MASSVDSAASAAVRTLLEAAKLTISEEELDKFIESYPILRSQADGLYLPHLDAAEPALSFDPTTE